MTSKPFNLAQAQEAYLRDKWTPEFYEGVERMVGMTTSKEIATDIIAEGMLRKGKDEVSNVYRVFMDVQHYIIDWMEKEREKKEKVRG